MKMKIFTIADLHLSFGTPGKKMDVFGPMWVNHPDKIAKNWKEKITNDDLVLIPGDISWARDPIDAVIDLMWIHELPGKKVMIRGNHDSWWQSPSKVRSVLPSSLQIVHNTSVRVGNVSIAGARLWENDMMDFSPFIDFQKPPDGVIVHKKEYTPEERQNDQRIFAKELKRLRASIDAMDKEADIRIVMTHYPPINPTHEENELTRLFHNEGIHYCLYGHLHHLKPDAPTTAKISGTKYICAACDWINFDPLELSTSNLEVESGALDL